MQSRDEALNDLIQEVLHLLTNHAYDMLHRNLKYLQSCSKPPYLLTGKELEKNRQELRFVADNIAASFAHFLNEAKSNIRAKFQAIDYSEDHDNKIKIQKLTDVYRKIRIKLHKKVIQLTEGIREDKISEKKTAPSDRMRSIFPGISKRSTKMPTTPSMKSKQLPSLWYDDICSNNRNETDYLQLNNRKKIDHSSFKLKPRKCYICNVIGHISFNCPKFDPFRKCYLCRETGHIAFVCPHTW